MKRIFLTMALTLTVTAAPGNIIRGSGFIYDGEMPACSGMFIYDSAMPLVGCSNFDTDSNQRVAS